MHRWVVSLFAIASSAQAGIIDIQRSDIDYYHGQIIVDYRLSLPANSEQVKSILQDFENFPKISRLIESSTVFVDKHQRTILKQDLRACILGVCLPISKEQELFTNKNGSISAVFSEKQSHFDGGFEQWGVSKKGNESIIHYQANVTPLFNLPPYVGMYFVRKFIDDEIKFVAKQILEKCS